MTKARDLHKAKVMDVCFTCTGRSCQSGSAGIADRFVTHTDRSPTG